jgi:acyl-CoA thioesterase I
MLYHIKYKQEILMIKLIAIKIMFFAFVLFMSVSANAAEKKTILAFGDSLMAGYGLDTEDSFTVQLENTLKASGADVSVINAGVSGDTSSGGFARLEWVLASQENLDLVIVEFGGNDALRGIHPDITRRSMDKMLAILQTKKIPTMIAGMIAPPNLGPIYGEQFNSIYSDLAEKYNVPLYPFFLDGVAGILELNQPDTIHPNKKGVGIITQRLAPFIIEVLNGTAD